MTKWHKGPPPHIGWWNASVKANNDIWRWWDGRVWSKPADCKQKASDIARQAATPCEPGCIIEWTTFYPKNARVPRIDPQANPQRKITYAQAKQAFDALLDKAEQHGASIFYEDYLCKIEITASTIKALTVATGVGIAILWYDSDYANMTYQEFHENFQKAFSLWKKVND